MELVTGRRRIVACGEAMLELTQREGAWALGAAGDTFNAAVHLARAGHDVAYLTALGADRFSDELRGAWRRQGLDCSLVLTHPTRVPGLYAIHTDTDGERSFMYWRDASAAREMFALLDAAAALAQAKRADLLLFSLVTLAILPPAAREQLIALAAAVRAAGGQVAFDGNYRPHLWHDPDEAIAARDAAITVADFGLPTLDDEIALGGAADAAAVAAHWAALGCDETVVKLGAAGCRLPDGRAARPDTGAGRYQRRGRRV